MRWVVIAMTLLTLLFSGLNVKAPAFCTDLPVKTLDKPTAQVYYVRVPASYKYKVMPLVSPQLEPLPDLVEKMEGSAIAGINAGFFDPNNKLTTSYVVSQGKIAANPIENRNFLENPDLYPFLVKMLNRSEFRVMDCHGKRKYAIAKHQDSLGFRCSLVHSVQAGPNLFVPDSALQEAFVAYKGNQRIRDPLGIDRKNARSAVGIDEAGNVILAMAAMKPLETEPAGVTLQEMAAVMRELGAKEALSLDGGSSSTLWVGGQTYYGKLDKAFNPVKRPIKSALVVIRED